MSNDDHDDGDLWEGLRTRPLDDFSEEAFLESERAGSPNFAILALAMGQWCSGKNFREGSGPTWAIDACKKYFRKSISGTRPVSTPTRGSPGRHDDGEVLTFAAMLLVDPEARVEFECSDGGAELSENHAIRVAISVVRNIPRQKVEASEIGRITYHWRVDRDRRLAGACETRGRKITARNPPPKR